PLSVQHPLKTWPAPIRCSELAITLTLGGLADCPGRPYSEEAEIPMRIRLLACLIVLFPLSFGSPLVAQSAADAPNQPKPEPGRSKTSPAQGVEILSNPMGIDFKPYIAKIIPIIRHTWQPLIPKEVDSPERKAGLAAVRFTIMPNGHLEPRSMVL